MSVADLLDGLVERIVKAVEILVRNLLKDTINTVKETLAAADRSSHSKV